MNITDFNNIACKVSFDTLLKHEFMKELMKECNDTITFFSYDDEMNECECLNKNKLACWLYVVKLTKESIFLIQTKKMLETQINYKLVDERFNCLYNDFYEPDNNDHLKEYENELIEGYDQIDEDKLPVFRIFEYRYCDFYYSIIYNNFNDVLDFYSSSKGIEVDEHIGKFLFNEKKRAIQNLIL
jgi:hypothetical protein